MSPQSEGTPGAPRVLRLGGVIEEWNDEHGYGFIHPEHGGRRVFVHISGFRPDEPRPWAGERITYVIAPAPGGRLQAAQVISRPGQRPPRTEPSWMLLGTALAVHVGFLAFAVTYWRMPWQVFLYSGLMSLLAFAVYAYDKRAAVLHHWRISESVMQSVALLGGWPGALVAQQLLRHKNRKQSFQTRFWTYVILHEVLLGVIMWRYQVFVDLLWNAMGWGTWTP